MTFAGAAVTGAPNSAGIFDIEKICDFNFA